MSAMSDLTQIKVADLIDLLEPGGNYLSANKLAWDAARLVVPLILDRAWDFYGQYDDDGEERADALGVAVAFVQQARRRMSPEDMKKVAYRLTRLAGAMMDRAEFSPKASPEVTAWLERIANSGESDQPSQPTTMVETVEERSVARASEHLARARAAE
jgi:hypothetical protein